MSIEQFLGVEDTTDLHLPAGLYTQQDILKGKPFAVLYAKPDGKLRLVAGGDIPPLKSKIVVN